jgi:hypothetical protein
VSTLTTSQIVALATDDLASIGTAQIVAITTAQVAALSTLQVSALATSQIAVMEGKDLARLTTAQIVALGTAGITALTTAQLSYLSSSHQDALTAAQVTALGTDITYVTPLILDLNGDGIQTQKLSAGVVFDLDASGTKETVGWASNADGLLARDLNGNGQIDDGSELFGSASLLQDGSRAQDGYQALSQLDTNKDGKISQADAAFGELAVWVDSNSDGLTERGELKSLTDLGITSLDLQAQKTWIENQGNQIGLVSSYTNESGEKLAMADVWLATTGHLDTAANALTQALDNYLKDQSVALLTSSTKIEELSETDGSNAKPDGAVVAMATSLAQFDSGGNLIGGNLGVPLNAVSMVDTIKQKLVDNEGRNAGLLGGTSNSG